MLIGLRFEMPIELNFVEAKVTRCGVDDKQEVIDWANIRILEGNDCRKTYPSQQRKKRV